MTAFVTVEQSAVTGPEAVAAVLSDGRVMGVVRLTGQVAVHCYTPAEAREVAQAFIELAGLMEQRERDAAATEATGDA